MTIACTGAVKMPFLQWLGFSWRPVMPVIVRHQILTTDARLTDAQEFVSLGNCHKNGLMKFEPLLPLRVVVATRFLCLTTVRFTDEYRLRNVRSGG